MKGTRAMLVCRTLTLGPRPGCGSQVFRVGLHEAAHTRQVERMRTEVQPGKAPRQSELDIFAGLGRSAVPQEPHQRPPDSVRQDAAAILHSGFNGELRRASWALEAQGLSRQAQFECLILHAWWRIRHPWLSRTIPAGIAITVSLRFLSLGG